LSEKILRLSQIVGQATAVKILRAALPPGLPGSGYLFAGPMGLGKMSSAMAWAQAMFCVERDGHDACGHCGPCLKIENGAHPDLLILAPTVKTKKVKQDIDIDSVRELIERLAYKPYEAARKIAIIEEADKMNLHAANAFLKTLEEPSGDTIAILTASNPSRLPATILSRCRIVRFTPAPIGEMVEYLRGKLGIDEKKARTIAVMSKGAVGASDPERLKEDIELRAMALDFITDARRAPAAKYYRQARAMDKEKNRETVDKFISMILFLLREMAVMKFTGKYDNVVNVDIVDGLDKAGRGYSGRCILGLAAAVEELMAARSLHINPFLTLSLLFLEFRKDP